LTDDRTSAKPLAPGLGLGRIERLSVYSSRRQSHVSERDPIVKGHCKEGVEKPPSRVFVFRVFAYERLRTLRPPDRMLASSSPSATPPALRQVLCVVIRRSNRVALAMSELAFLQPRRCDQDTAPHSYRVRVCERWRSTIDNSDTRVIPAPEPKDERFRGITR
jgi:hypothetical protein